MTPHRYLKSLTLLLLTLLSLNHHALADQQPTEVQAMLFARGLEQIAREYERQNTGVRILYSQDPRIVDKVRVRILEGSFPEVSDAPVNYGRLIEAGKIQPLDEFLDAPRGPGQPTWRETFLPGSFDRFRYNGQNYGIPLWYSTYGFWYNRKLFREKGWQTPETWDELLALCEQIQAEGDGIAPIAFQGQYPQYLHQLINTTLYQLGGRDYFEAMQKGQEGTYDHPVMIEMLRLVRKLADEHFQPGAEGMSHTQAQLEFFRGNTAMVMCGTWLLTEMADQIPDDFEVGFFKYPYVPGPNAEPTAIAGGTGYYFVFSAAPNPEAAVEFMRFATAPEQAAIIAGNEQRPVAIRGVNQTALNPDLREVAAVLETVTSIFAATPDDDFAEINQQWQDVRTRILEADNFDPAAEARFLEDAAAKIRAQKENPDHVTVRHVFKPILLLTILGAGVVYVLVMTSLQIRRAYTNRDKVEAGGMRIRFSVVAVFLLPALLFYSVFVVIPSLSSFAWSVQRWDGLTDMEPIGFLHFQRLLFEDDGFWIALRNNFFIMFVIPLFVIPLALFLATCLSRGVWGSWLFRIVFFFPNLLGVAAILLWQQMYNPAGGPINEGLVALADLLNYLNLETTAIAMGLNFRGFENYAWLSQQNLYWSLIPMMIWAACGFNMVLYLAAMQSIPESLYEAAEIDGATPWHQFWTITIPLIWEALSVSIVFLVIAGMKAFEVIWLLTNQSPNTQTHVIGTRMVWAMFSEFRVGQAAAIAVLLFIMVFFGTAATLRLMKREAVEL
ncbi:extracellular solute-binding protein [Mucisphaera sp.]|uniref:extracellular solute-binding protein n=1 Tax=Mucisphaera sp. TaxID=2913024 RepID=UPI003D0D36AA